MGEFTRKPRGNLECDFAQPSLYINPFPLANKLYSNIYCTSDIFIIETHINTHILSTKTLLSDLQFMNQNVNLRRIFEDNKN